MRVSRAGFAVSNAEVNFDKFTRPTVDFALNGLGPRRLRRLTSGNKGLRHRRGRRRLGDLCAPSAAVSSGLAHNRHHDLYPGRRTGDALNAGAEPTPLQGEVEVSTVPIED